MPRVNLKHTHHCCKFHHGHGRKKLTLTNGTATPLCQEITSAPATDPTSVPLILTEQPHDNHTHTVWAGASKLAAQKDNPLAKLYTKEGEEGCPCCTAGLDFDEFAAALKELAGNVDSHHGLAELADFSSGANWGIFLGISAPLSIIGLTAASRNITGCLKNRKGIVALLKGVDAAIASNRHCASKMAQLRAFRKTLQYSKFDTDFNLIVPGGINGAASTLVLSSAVLSHPFALPAIGLYALCQLGRNIYDFIRIIGSKLSIKNQDSPETATGKAKVNQVINSKRRFFVANTTGFALFATGALLTLLSIPAVGVAGLGIAGLAVGLSLLSFGALSTGVTNNIWPRKFRPRNGDLGIARFELDEKSCLKEIASRKRLKTHLKKLNKDFGLEYPWQKFGIMVRSAMPQFKDFLPEKAARTLAKAFWFLPRTGSNALDYLHNLEKKRIYERHKDSNISQDMSRARNQALLKMRAGSAQPLATLTAATTQQSLITSWEHLQALGLADDAVSTYLNENFYNGLKPHQCSGGYCHHSEHKHESSAHHQRIKGLEEGEHNSNFSLKRFLRTANQEDVRRLNAAIDFFLVKTLLGKLQYQQYGLIDFLQALKAKN